MNKILLSTTFSLFLTLNFSLAAGPYTAALNADAFDATPDSVPTPNQNTDFGGGIQIRNALNLLLGTSYTNNAAADALQYTGNDNIWTVTNNTPRVTLIGVNAGYTNTLRAYDALNPAVKTDLFGQGFTGLGFRGNGTLANPFTSALIPFDQGTNIGFNLKSSEPGFDSNPLFNSDKLDHMLTYDLPGLENKSFYVRIGNNAPELYTFTDPYLVAWEDLPGLGDQDYNDAIFVLDRVSPQDRVVPVPEPMTLGLMGSGLVGLLAFRRKKA